LAARWHHSGNEVQGTLSEINDLRASNVEPA
jgi:hypothetical protein